MPGLDAFLKPLRVRDAEPVQAAPALVGPISLDLRDADVTLYSQLWSDLECCELIPKLAALPDWEQRQILVCGRPCIQNRQTCFFSRDPSLNYRYSGIDNDNAKPFPPIVEWICKRVSERLGIQFNYCLLNLYSDGSEKIGWHADDERDLVSGSPIASCSFGAARFFDLRRRDNHADKLRINLESGSLIVMGEGTQANYHHQVPSQMRIKEPRYNLTFRVVRPATGG
jgi:alkylated DNA repair dioxygenase AlkB